METSFKNWLCPNFLSLPKKSELPKLWGATAPLAPPARTPMDITSASSGEFFPGFYYNNNNSDNHSDDRHNDNERSKIRTSRSISVKRQEVGSMGNKAIMKKVVNLKKNLHHIKRQNKKTPKGHPTILFNENQYWIKRESLQQKSCTLNFDKKNITLLIRNVFVLGLDSTFKKGFFSLPNPSP